jgi:hypothetical protein
MAVQSGQTTMLSYNDALQHSQPDEASCVVCHDLVPAEHIIWHAVKVLPDGCEPNERIVAICIDCADLFHDVKPQVR